MIRFLSTPSARRATASIPLILANALISIHALREEGDHTAGRDCHTAGYFYPHPPRGGRHRRARRNGRVRYISIHALREEGDAGRGPGRLRPAHFYPRPPRGGRLMCAVLSPSTSNFYPRPPRGGRPNASIIAFSPSYFYPRPPRGGRLQQLVADLEAIEFLSTPSARRATCVPW